MHSLQVLAITGVTCLLLEVTMSTVGYGDLSPTKPGTKVFTVFYIFVGIGVVFPRISTVFSLLTTPIVTAGRNQLERWFPSEGVDINGDGEIDILQPRSSFIFYGKNLSPTILFILVVQLIYA